MTSGRLDGRVAIVTGSTRGIGRAVAQAYAREGAAVVVNGTRADASAAIADAIRESGGRAVACAAEIGSRHAAERLVAAALDTWGRLDILVNNAAISSTQALVDYSEAVFDREVAVNLRGVFLNTQVAVARAMAEQGSGKIINLTSFIATRGAAGKTGYAATKAAVAGLTLSWATELAPLRINVNAVAPSAWTDMAEGLPEARKAVMKEGMIRNSVLQRVALPEDLAGTMVFLASSDSDYLTGQILLVNGQAMHLL